MQSLKKYIHRATFPKLYRSYYPHRSRDSVSPICGIFLVSFLVSFIEILYRHISKTNILTLLKIWGLRFCRKNVNYDNWNGKKTIKYQISPKFLITFSFYRCDMILTWYLHSIYMVYILYGVCRWNYPFFLLVCTFKDQNFVENLTD